MSTVAGNMSLDSNPEAHRLVGQTVEELQNSVFSNDLIWSLLAKYLNFGDLEVSRLVSRNFNRKVLDATNFKSRGVIQLNKKRLRPNVFGTTAEKWVNINIQAVALNPKSKRRTNLTWLYSHLSDVEELYVWADRDYTHETWDFYPPLHKLLEATNCLKKLCFDEEFLRQTEVNIQLPSSKTVDDTLANLTGLELTATRETRERSRSIIYSANFREWMDYFTTALKNVQVLRSIGIIPEHSKSPDGMNEDLRLKKRNLLRIIESNYAHLTNLRLDDMKLQSTSFDPTLRTLSRMVFPRLISVKIHMSQMESRNMIQFIRQQPLLRDIDVTVLNEFPVELFEVILERKGLTQLCMKAKIFEEFSTILLEGLSGLINLEIFVLHVLPSHEIEVAKPRVLPSCLQYLAPSVRKIELKGIPSGPVCSTADMEITRDTLSNLNLNPAFVTELCFNNCNSCVDNAVLEFVFRNFRFIRVLNLSDTNFRCTDYGFIGSGCDFDFVGRPLLNSTPFSISDLRGLRHLTLRSCGSISDETLIHGIKFTELSYLDVSGNCYEKITRRGCRAVLAQNPSLEVLKTSANYEFERFKSEELKKLYPRLKEYIKLTPKDLRQLQ